MIISFLLNIINQKTFWTFNTLNYHRLAKFFRVLNKTILKTIENVNIKVKITSFKIKNYFFYKDHIPNNLKLSWYLNLLLLAAVLATLSKHVVNLKSGLRNISKTIRNLIFPNIYLPTWHALTCIILFSFKTIDKPNSLFDLKVRVALLINWHKPDLNMQQRI